MIRPRASLKSLVVTVPLAAVLWGVVGLSVWWLLT